MKQSSNKKNEKIKISIIMSLYNVEFFMEKAIESVLNQTLEDIELICINDGSTDNTLCVLKKYAKKDNRIKVISYEESKGQAYARNQGINIAKGNYIGFVDSDDWVDFDIFNKLYKNAETNTSDIAFCGAALYNELSKKYDYNNSYYNQNLIPATLDNKVFNHSDTKELLTGSINVALWNKIYKRDFINKNKIRLPEYFIYEDMPFFYETWFKANKISMIRDIGYFYRINRIDSTMSNIGNKVLNRIDMVALTYEKFKKLPYFNEIKTKVNSWIIDDLFHRYTLVDSKYRKEFFFLMKKMFKNLDLNGVDIEEFSKSYCYKEYKNCMEMKYEDFIVTLTDTYINTKKVKQELTSKMKFSNYQTQLFYENIINNIKEEYEKRLQTK